MQQLILAFSGRIGAGKSTCCDFLVRNFYEIFNKHHGNEHHIKRYSIANKLKNLCIELFNLPTELVFGNQNDKNKEITFKWEDMPNYLEIAHQEYYTKSGHMTYREFLQNLGTNVFRRIYPTIWIDYCLRQIKTENYMVAVIDDLRFLDEAEEIKKVGGKLIRLTRMTENLMHSSETDLDNYDGFDVRLENHNLTITETNQKLTKIVQSWI